MALYLGVSGLALCLFGWVIYNLGIRAVGFLSGALFGGFVGLGLSVLPALVGHELLMVVIGAVIFGLVGVALAGGFQYLLAFIGGAVAGVAIKKLFGGELDALFEEASGVAASITYDWGDLVAAVIGGLLFMAAARYFIVVITAAVGASMLAVAFDRRWVMPVAAAVGVAVQLLAMRGFGVRPEEPTRKQRGALGRS